MSHLIPKSSIPVGPRTNRVHTVTYRIFFRSDFPIEDDKIEEDVNEGEVIERVKMPVFKGTLPPDVTFLGFELTEDQAKGSTNFGEEPGWFFIIEERVSELRFGADALTGDAVDLKTWDDLSWDHLKENKWVKYPEDPTGHVRITSGIDLTPSGDDGDDGDDDDGDDGDDDGDDEIITWGENSSSIAWITLQKPFRLAIHADDMLPKKESNN